MPKFEELRDVLGEILRERPDCYWLCYQILRRLEEVHPDVLERLREKYGTGHGQGGGAYYRPDSAIANCLSDWRECVDVQYLLGRNLQVGNARATDDLMGIYRWTGQT